MEQRKPSEGDQQSSGAASAKERSGKRDPEGSSEDSTLTTRIRINIPGSRPIPPVVIRTPVMDVKGDASTSTEAEGPPAKNWRAGGGGSTAPHVVVAAWLKADAALVARLHDDDFQGPATDLLIARLTAYGNRFLHKGILNSSLFKRCMDLNRPVGNSHERAFLREHGAVREDLVSDLLTVANKDFRERALRGGEWDPTRGSSLKSYYVGKLVLEFPNAYRRWRTQWSREGLLHAVDSDGIAALEYKAARMFLLPTAPDPARQAVVSDLLERALQAGDEEIRKIAEMRKLGFEWEEIGVELGKTGNAASEKWRRFCVNVRTRQEGLDVTPGGPSDMPRPSGPLKDQLGERSVKEV